MAAHLRPAGMLKQYIQDRPSAEVEPGLSVHAALKGLGIPPELVALVLVNGQSQPKDYRICDGDDIQVIAVIGGG
jgi:sulfur carrier protein ThiS